MPATKILWGQLLTVSLIALGFVWAATQWTAWRLGFQPQLDTAWFELGVDPVRPGCRRDGRRAPSDRAKKRVLADRQQKLPRDGLRW